VRVVQLVCSDRFAGVERYIAYIAPGLAARGCEVAVVGGAPEQMRRALAGSATFAPARNVVEAICQVARNLRADVIHAHMTAAEWALVPARPVTKAVFVSSRHFAADRGRPGLVRRLSRIVPKVLDEELSISSFVASSLAEPSVVLRNGVPAHSGHDDRQPVVLLLQRLEKEKDTALALDAWSRCTGVSHGWRLQLAGAGSEEAALRERAAALGIAGSVDFLGHRSDTPALLDSAGLFLATASAEPFGLSVAEAMAAGVPVVATASGAHLETVGSCRDDFLYPPGDAAACAALLTRLIEDPVTRDVYGTALQQHQREHLNLEGHIDRLLEIYVQLIGRRARG
jgi:glycosyltransferase involved in cell wall biosynthesis